jgi:Na+-driven multidrug efflux pump
VLSISTFFTMFLALAATYFVPDLVRHHYAGSFYLLPPRYWIGLSILPWIFLSYVFDMISTNLSAGILITGNTRYLPVVTFAGAAVTAFFCWWLVPVSGMDGAAFAIVAGTVVMCLVMTWYSLKVFPVPYDWLKLFLLFVVGIVLGWFEYFAGPKLPQAGALLAAKTALLALYLACAMVFFREEALLISVKVRNKFRLK